jgi:hypothetical protein
LVYATRVHEKLILEICLACCSYLKQTRLMSSWKFSDSNRLIIEVGSGYDDVKLLESNRESIKVKLLITVINPISIITTLAQGKAGQYCLLYSLTQKE